MGNNNIFKSGVRIFRPCDVSQIVKAISKIENKDKFEALLYTGCRFNELQWLYEHKDAFTGDTILMPSFKPKAKHKERYIRLNSNGKRAVTYFLRAKTNLPARDGWNANLKRWCIEAGIDVSGVCSKSTRKTWESWLMMMYPDKYPLIFLSQGHTDKVSMDYYLMLPFSDTDKMDMHFYVDGWI
jgi:integrase